MTILGDEISSDPLGRGYSGMTDQELIDSFNIVNNPDPSDDRTLSRETVNSAELYEAIDRGELTALPVEDRATMNTILGLGPDILTGPTSKTRADLIAIFVGAQNVISRTALIALVEPTVSRAVELGEGVPTLKTLKLESIR